VRNNFKELGKNRQHFVDVDDIFEMLIVEAHQMRNFEWKQKSKENSEKGFNLNKNLFLSQNN
jgi:hypothetical protein